MNLRFGVPETGLLAHRTVPALLAPAELIPGHRRDVDALLAWGRRPSALRVERLGRRWQLPVWHLEDGLLRSLSKGAGIRRWHWWTTGFTSMPPSPAGWSSASLKPSPLSRPPGPRRFSGCGASSG